MGTADDPWFDGGSCPYSLFIFFRSKADNLLREWSAALNFEVMRRGMSEAKGRVRCGRC